MNIEGSTQPSPVHERLPAARGARSKANLYLAVLSFLALGMFGFAYANAEFFVTICRQVGLLAPEPTQLRGDAGGFEKGRPIDVYFTATTADNLPIVFSVQNRFQKTHVGERMINDYKFVNMSNETLYFKPVHDVFPMAAGADNALILEACFCFTQQKIGPLETLRMPVIYTFTDKIPSDAEVLKMSYTLHLSDKASYEAAQAAYQAGIEQALHSKGTP